MNIALKEADEAAYWLELLHESVFLVPQAFESIYEDCNCLSKFSFLYSKPKPLNSYLLTMKNQSELTVITKAKDLWSYVMTVTQKSPK